MHPCMVSDASRIALIPLSCGMLVHNDLTSVVARIVLGDNGVSRVILKTDFCLLCRMVMSCTMV